MDERTFKGEWWSPDKPEDRVPGIVEYKPEGGEAELFGLLGEPPEDVDTEDQTPKDYHEGTIFGETTDSGYVTIPEAIGERINSPHRLDSEGLPSHHYLLTRIYVGGHYVEEPEFEQLTFSFDGLAEWFGDSRISLENTDEDEEVRSKYSVKHPKETVVELDSSELIFVASSRTSRSSTETVLKDSVDVNLQPDSPLTFAELRRQYILPLQRYLALATGVAVQPTHITGVDSDGDKVKILSRISESAPTERSVSRASMLFHREHVDLEQSIQHWFENKDDVEYLLDFYFGTMYNPQLYLQHQFISLAVALESYFGHQYSDYREMDEDEYKQLRRDIVKEIPDEAGAKKRISNLLTSIGNLPSFQDKLKMVVEKYEPILESMMDPDSTLSLATNIRHDLAHGLGREYSSDDLANVRYRLQVMSECILLDIVGISDDAKLRILLSRYDGADFIDVNAGDTESK